MISFRTDDLYVYCTQFRKYNSLLSLRWKWIMCLVEEWKWIIVFWSINERNGKVSFHPLMFRYCVEYYAKKENVFAFLSILTFNKSSPEIVFIFIIYFLDSIRLKRLIFWIYWRHFVITQHTLRIHADDDTARCINNTVYILLC